MSAESPLRTNTGRLVDACNDLQALTSRIRTEKGLLKRRVPIAAPSNISETQKRRKLVGSSGDVTASLPDFKQERLSHNREAFFDRLRSFSLDFILRRRPVSALECAMHGFRDSRRVPTNHVSRLVCDQCKGENYIIDLSSKDPKRCERFVQKYKESLITHHEEGCYWRTNVCIDGIYAFPIRTHSEALDFITGQAQKMIANEHFLPRIRHAFHEHDIAALDTFIRKTEDLPGFNTFATEPINPTLFTAYILPMYGWQLLHDKQVVALECHHCFRRVRLPLEQNHTNVDADGEVYFHANLEHHDYCAWVNRDTAMVTSPRQSAVAATAPLCGYEWMRDIIHEEHFALFRQRESSPLYKESRLAWYRQQTDQIASSSKAMLSKFDAMMNSRSTSESVEEEKEPSVEVQEASDEKQQELVAGEEQEQPELSPEEVVTTTQLTEVPAIEGEPPSEELKALSSETQDQEGVAESGMEVVAQTARATESPAVQEEPQSEEQENLAGEPLNKEADIEPVHDEEMAESAKPNEAAIIEGERPLEESEMVSGETLDKETGVEPVNDEEMAEMVEATQPSEIPVIHQPPPSDESETDKEAAAEPVLEEDTTFAEEAPAVQSATELPAGQGDVSHMDTEAGEKMPSDEQTLITDIDEGLNIPEAAADQTAQAATPSAEIAALTEEEALLIADDQAMANEAASDEKLGEDGIDTSLEELSRVAEVQSVTATTTPAAASSSPVTAPTRETAAAPQLEPDVAEKTAPTEDVTDEPAEATAAERAEEPTADEFEGLELNGEADLEENPADEELRYLTDDFTNEEEVISTNNNRDEPLELDTHESLETATDEDQQRQQRQPTENMEMEEMEEMEEVAETHEPEDKETALEIEPPSGEEPVELATEVETEPGNLPVEEVNLPDEKADTVPEQPEVPVSNPTPETGGAAVSSSQEKNISDRDTQSTNEDPGSMDAQASTDAGNIDDVADVTPDTLE
ncbi:hypothetical protein BCR43DRAFT_524457 [Syncephalastrum racemosum]|uniref:C3HC zinc finger-like-domain-containing protein n=1 Tax=Syncephalastrum racemosum TaxID=13706 RepID=A0A1X2HC18_SYNRA|nr:hypothetical protein BCR43DRAFT_524457 [Syncephalastrum racemosum]